MCFYQVSEASLSLRVRDGKYAKSIFILNKKKQKHLFVKLFSKIITDETFLSLFEIGLKAFTVLIRSSLLSCSFQNLTKTLLSLFDFEQRVVRIGSRRVSRSLRNIESSHDDLKRRIKLTLKLKLN